MQSRSIKTEISTRKNKMKAKVKTKKVTTIPIAVLAKRSSLVEATKIMPHYYYQFRSVFE